MKWQQTSYYLENLRSKIVVFCFREDFANSSWPIFTNAPIGIPPRGCDHLINDVLRDLNNILYPQ